MLTNFNIGLGERGVSSVPDLMGKIVAFFRSCPTVSLVISSAFT